MFASSLVNFFAGISLVSAHGFITSPPIRQPGPEMEKVCGPSAVKNINADPSIPVEDVFPDLPTCNVNFCRGTLLQDNKDRVQTFFPGQVVPFTANIAIPHEGPCNVSIIRLANNSIIGPPLISFASYANEALNPLPANNTAFTVTIPPSFAISGDCQRPGECLMRWFWFGTKAKQTYDNCVDFVIGQSGASTGNPTGNLPTATAGSAGSRPSAYRKRVRV